MYIDESQDAEQKTSGSNLYLCVSLVLSEYKDEAETALTDLKERLQADQFIGLNKKAEKRLLHFNEDNEEIKQKCIDVFRMLFFKSYIARLSFGAKKYNFVYYTLFRNLVKNRLVRYKDRHVVIRYEENSKIKLKDLESNIERILNLIDQEGKHRIAFRPVLEKVSKNDLFVSFPDYSLGVFMSFVQEMKSQFPAAYKINRFEKIRNKIKLFIDLNNSKYHSSDDLENMSDFLITKP